LVDARRTRRPSVNGHELRKRPSPAQAKPHLLEEDDQRADMAREAAAWLGRPLPGKPRRGGKRVGLPGDAGLPAGYMDAVAWLLARQSWLTARPAGDDQALERPDELADVSARERLERCNTVDRDLGARFRRLVFELDLDVQARCLSGWGA